LIINKNEILIDTLKKELELSKFDIEKKDKQILELENELQLQKIKAIEIRKLYMA
jgi:hypothetical protein